MVEVEIVETMVVVVVGRDSILSTLCFGRIVSSIGIDVCVRLLRDRF